jgi:hypothetical protein
MGKRNLKCIRSKCYHGTKCHDLWEKLAIKHIRTNCNKGMKCHRIGWLYYREIKCLIVTFSPNFWV